MTNFFQAKIFNRYFLTSAVLSTFTIFNIFSARPNIRNSFINLAETEESVTLQTDSLIKETFRKTDSIVATSESGVINRIGGPTVFSGYRHRTPHKFQTQPIVYSAQFEETTPEENIAETTTGVYLGDSAFSVPSDPESVAARKALINGEYLPQWLSNAIRSNRLQDNFIYDIMIADPSKIDYAYWELPEPPRLPEDDVTFASYIKRLYIPEVKPVSETLEVADLEKRHWLHVVESGVQFSQAYLSSNWYQGGNDYLSLLFNFLWDVKLNTVYHPNLMFNSTLSYKLGLNSTPNDKFHKYSISQDLFQYNMKAGLKAFTSWFYSFNMQFKTQLLNNYPADSDIRSASFLSPGDLNMGLGMTYNHNNSKNTFKLSVSISPLSYNMKTCIDNLIDHAQFNIAPNKKFRAEFGSNAEMNFEWQITDNINWRNRVFLFTDYSYFSGDMENTFSFILNKFLSTQLYVHLRYDSSNDASTSKWRHWMLKEILSFGLTYRFSTK